MTEETNKSFETEAMSLPQPSKAATLARELGAEKKRLEQELEELHADYENIKPTTPTGTIDWGVKWLAVIMAVIGVFLMSAGLDVYGQFFYILSAICWILVGMNWGDRAIMIGSSISGTAVAMDLLKFFVS